MKEKTKDTEFNTFIFRALSLMIIIICLIIFIIWQKDNSINGKIQTDLEGLVSIEESSSTQEFIILNENILNEEGYNSNENNNDSNNYNINVDFDILSQKNSDTVGWIAFNTLNINYPVVKANDNSYYITHNFYKNKNSAGWIFADTTNNFPILDKNTIIYGHNRRNGTMFSKLNNYLNSAFCSNEENQTFLFATKEVKYEAKIFSAYKVNATGFTIKTNFESETSFFDYLNQLDSNDKELEEKKELADK